MEGAVVCVGAAVPVSSMKSGPVRASLSMTRVPVSVVGAEAGAPVAVWLRGV